MSSLSEQPVSNMLQKFHSNTMNFNESVIVPKESSQNQTFQQSETSQQNKFNIQTAHRHVLITE